MIPDTRPGHNTRMSSDRVLRWSVAGLFLLALLATIHFTRGLLLPIAIGTILALILEPLVGWLRRLRIPRAIAAALVVIGTIGAVSGLGMRVYEPAREWAASLPASLPEARRKLATLRKPIDVVRDAAETVSKAAEAPSRDGERTVYVERAAAGGLTATQDAVVGIGATVLILYFLLASGPLFRAKLCALARTPEGERRVLLVCDAVRNDISRFVVIATVLNLGLGIATGLLALAVGLPNPALLGTLAALLNYIPYVGAAVMIAILGLASVLQFDTAGMMMLPPLAFLVLTTIEGQVLQPLLYGRQMSVAPVVVFLWVLGWGWMWGLGGVFVAVPSLMAIRICAAQFPGLRPLAILLAARHSPLAPDPPESPESPEFRESPELPESAVSPESPVSPESSESPEVPGLPELPEEVERHGAVINAPR